MYRTILVPLDGSLRAEWALPTAVRLARASHARISLLTVEVPVPVVAVGMGMLPEVPVPDYDRAAEYLHHVADALSAKGVAALALGVVEPTAMLFASVGREIAHRAKLLDAGLVVMTTHARSKIGTMLMGSVARDTVHASEAAVLLVKPPDIEQPPSYDGQPLGRILVALDTAQASEEILPYAIELGRTCDAQFTIVTVVKPGHFPGVPVDPLGLPVDSLSVGEMQQRAREYQESMIERLRLRGLSVEGTVIVADDVAEAIALAARDSGADVIAMTTHARRGIGNIFFGSVASELIRALPLPVLLYHPRA
jgi:nucleotide-binding universal stress UspA family protein